MHHIKLALSQYGVSEIPGRADNPTIVNYFHEIGHKWVADDETAWCSAFANWVCKRSNLTMSGKLNARSWLSVGTKVKYPQTGDIVVLWRSSPNSWKGHVGFFISQRNVVIILMDIHKSNNLNDFSNF